MAFAARITDMHTCPMQTPAVPSPIPHVGGPVVGPGAPTVLIGGIPAAVMGDTCVYHYKRFCNSDDLRKARSSYGRYHGSWRVDCIGMPDGDDRGLACLIILF